MRACWMGILVPLLACGTPQERLRRAIFNDRPDDAEAALRAGADPNGGLEQAISSRRLEVMRRLLAHKADPNHELLDGARKPQSLLQAVIVAVDDSRLRLDFLRALLEAGADPNRVPKDAEPPLLEALEFYRSWPGDELLLFLLEHKADPNLRARGMCGLDLLLARKECTRKLVEAFLAAGARASESAAVPIAVARGHADLVPLLIERGARPDAVCPSRSPAPTDTRGLRGVLDGAWGGPCGRLTALAWAAGKGDLATMKDLLERGAKVNAPETGGVRPLHVASRLAQLEAVRLLLERGADPKALDEEGATALHGAGSEKIIRALLAAGLGVNTPDKDGDTPLWWAVVDDLREPRTAESEDTAASKETEGELQPLALVLLAAGAAPDRPGSDGLRPIHWAARHKDVQTVRRLLALKARAGARDGKEIAPVAYILEQHVSLSGLREALYSMVSLLLEHGASGQARGSKGESALAMAVRHGYPDTARILLDAGADPASVKLDNTVEEVSRAKTPRDKVIAAARARLAAADAEARRGAAWADSAREREAAQAAERKAADEARAKAAAERESRSKEVERLRRRGYSEDEIERRLR